ncbi:MAG: hypothetical protein ACQERB_03810 [Promethearchaeati archaeon]
MNLVEIVRYLLSDLYRKYRKKYDISISIEELFRDLIESVIDRDQEYFIEGNEVFLIRKDQERLESQSFISKNDYYIALKYLKSQEIISFSDIHHPDTKITINLDIIHIFDDLPQYTYLFIGERSKDFLLGDTYNNKDTASKSDEEFDDGMFYEDTEDELDSLNSFLEEEDVIEDPFDDELDSLDSFLEEDDVIEDPFDYNENDDGFGTEEDLSCEDYYEIKAYSEDQECSQNSQNSLICEPHTKKKFPIKIIRFHYTKMQELLFNILAGGCLFLSVSILMLGLVSLVPFFNTNFFLIILGIISLILSLFLTFLIWFNTAISMAQTLNISINSGILVIIIPSIILILIMIF